MCFSEAPQLPRKPEMCEKPRADFFKNLKIENLKGTFFRKWGKWKSSNGLFSFSYGFEKYFRTNTFLVKHQKWTRNFEGNMKIPFWTFLCSPKNTFLRRKMKILIWPFQFQIMKFSKPSTWTFFSFCILWKTSIGLFFVCERTFFNHQRFFTHFGFSGKWRDLSKSRHFQTNILEQPWEILI